jgi:hypothetical protein
MIFITGQIGQFGGDYLAVCSYSPCWCLVFGLWSTTTALIRDLIGRATTALLVALFVI